MFEHPCLDLRMPYPQEINRADPVVFFGGGTRLVALNLSDNSGWALNPFGQCAKTAPQAMYRKSGQASLGKCLVVLDSRFLQSACFRGFAAEYPRRGGPVVRLLAITLPFAGRRRFIFCLENRKQAGYVGCQRDGPLSFNFVADS